MKNRSHRSALAAILLLALPALDLQAQENPLQSGPMVGRAEMQEVEIWAQTRTPALVRVYYREKSAPSRRFATALVQTQTRDACVAHLLADSVKPGRVYTYEIEINGRNAPRAWPLEFRTPPLWQWRGDPPSFTVATGSCAYINQEEHDRPGSPYGGDYRIFASIAGRRPEIMLWLGDNVYLREVDWNSRTGYLRRYTHTRSIPEMGPLLGASCNYAIWVDHDYGPNNSDRGFREKETALEVFRLFWCNPTYGTREMPGIATSFEWGDAEFFLLDNRWNRSPNDRVTGERQILGDRQIEWLIDRLSASTATFRIVALGGQLLNPVARFENHATYPEERQKLIDAITTARIPGVILLSGDRHCTELSMLPRQGAYPLYELTVSPLTSRAFDNSTEPNTLRVDGTHLGRRNFATLAFSGPLKERVVTIRVFDVDGAMIWERSIKAGDLGSGS